MKLHSLLLLLWVFTSACELTADAPIPVTILVPDAEGQFHPFHTELTTVSNLSRLEGSVATLLGGARMNFNEARGITLEEYRKTAFQEEGRRVHAQFVKKEGSFWPADFHSWAMTTAYWNLEQAFLYFQKAYDGRELSELQNIHTYYWLDFTELGGKKSATDNAFFYPSFRMMAVLPFHLFQLIPMSINIGVMAHEYGHFVFDARVFHADPHSPIYYTQGESPWSILYGVNEGMADFHAYGVTRALNGKGMADFIDWSLGKVYGARRDFSRNNPCMSSKLRSELENKTFADFYASGRFYEIGTLFASALYHSAGGLDVHFDALARAVVHAYDDPSPDNPGLRQLYLDNRYTPHKITLESVANVFLAHIPETHNLRSEACLQMLDRLQLRCPSFPCPALPACHAIHDSRPRNCP